ncbi:hypothetical protein AAG906_010684 [Vitis piasezkii]
MHGCGTFGVGNLNYKGYIVICKHVSEGGALTAYNYPVVIMIIGSMKQRCNQVASYSSRLLGYLQQEHSSRPKRFHACFVAWGKRGSYQQVRFRLLEGQELQEIWLLRLFKEKAAYGEDVYCGGCVGGGQAVSLLPSCKADLCLKAVEEQGGSLLSSTEGILSPIDEALVVEAASFQCTLNHFSPSSGWGFRSSTPSSFSPMGEIDEGRRELGMIYWREMTSMDRGVVIEEEESRGVPFAMVLKDGSLLNFKSNYDVVELDNSGGEEEAQTTPVKGCVPVEVRRKPAFSQGNFNKLVSFSKFLGLLVDGFEKEILGLLRRLEFRTNRKTAGQVLKSFLGVRGINEGDKHKIIKSMIWSYLADFVCLQETKVQQMNDSLVKSLRVGRCLNWGVVEARGQAGKEREDFWDELSAIRGLWNDPWCRVVSSSLPNPISDRGPILLYSGGIRRGKIPFRFENMWLKVEGFKDLVRNWWEGYNVQGSCSYILDAKLKALKQDLKSWNKEVFGNVSSKKLEALAQLGLWGAKEREQTLTVEEIEVRRGVVDEFNKWAEMEEISWRSFHKMANAQRRRNFLAKLKVNGELLVGEDSNKEGPIVSAALEFPFFEEEVLATLFDLDGDKALGQDGFSLAFWQYSWDIVKLEHAFVEEKQILDAVLIANEAIDSRIKDNLKGILYKKALLSPYLFILVMEAFSPLLSRANEGGFINGFQVCSGLKINLRKSELIRVGNVQNLEELAEILGCKVTTLPTTYLGLPLGASYKCLRVWEGVEGGLIKGLPCGSDNISQKTFYSSLVSRGADPFPRVIVWNPWALVRLIFALFDVQWVMNSLVRRLLLSWGDSFVGKKRKKGWKVALLSTCKHAKEAWDTLEVIYEGTLAVKLSKIQMLTSIFESIRMQDDQTFSAFYYELSDIVNSSFNLGERILESKIVRMILRYILERFKPKVTTIEKSMLATWSDTDSNLSDSTASKDTRLLLEGDTIFVKCKEETPNHVAPSSTSPLCAYCKKSGHSKHVTGDKFFFTSFEDFNGGNVTFSDGSIACVRGRRLGHINYEDLVHLTNKDLVRGIPKLSDQPNTFYGECMKGK